jgi:S1-C subfamily serine protease
MLTYFRDGKENSVPVTLKNFAGNTNLVTPGMGIGVVYGARFEALSSTDKRMFNIDYGVRIVDIGDGKFKDMGLKKGTILITVNGKKVKTSEDVRQATNNETSLKSIEGIQPDGTIFNYRYGN